MKKIIVIAALAATIFAGCTKEEKISSASDSPISFNTAVGKAKTKALILDNTYPTSVTFGTFAYYYKGTSGSSQQLYINNNEVKNENTSTSGTAWTTKTKYYWPKTGTLSFFSYSPYTINKNNTVDCTPSTGITISGYDVYGGTTGANQTVDVMVAKPVSGNVDDREKSGYTGVPTVFHHVLSQIVGFNFTNTHYTTNNDPDNPKPIDGAKRFTITKISINNIAYTGSYQELYTAKTETNAETNAGWTATSDIASYTLYDSKSSTAGILIEGTENKPVPFNITNGYLLVLPQTLTGAKSQEGEVTGSQIEITYFIETYCDGHWVEENPIRVSSALSGTWAENTKITYNISFNLDNDQIYWAPSVDDWGTDNYSESITL